MNHSKHRLIVNIFNQAVLYHSNNQYVIAALYYKYILRLAPKDYKTKNNLGILYNTISKYSLSTDI